MGFVVFRFGGCFFSGELRQFCLCVGQGFFVALLNFVINFLAVNGNIDWRINPDFYYIAFHPHDAHDDPAINDDAFTRFTRENQHGSRMLLRLSGKWQRMSDRILGGIDRDDLFANPCPAIDYNRAL